MLRGDRGLTYSATVPDNATLSEGTWWDADYAGEPLVSFTAQEGMELGLKLGDTITVNILGRNITAKIASFRAVKWETMGINFVMVFSPNTFAGAPHSWIATLTDKDTTAGEESTILNTVTKAYPAVTSVRVKDALDIVNRLVGQLGTAIRAAASVALIASILVLAGALAAGNRARIHDAVVLKTLGATRRTLIAAFSLEYMLIGLATAVFALAAGGVAAWFVVARIMTLPWIFSPMVALSTVAHRAGADRRHRPGRDMADPRSQGRPDPAHRIGIVAVTRTETASKRGADTSYEFVGSRTISRRNGSCSSAADTSYSIAGMLESRQRRPDP